MEIILKKIDLTEEMVITIIDGALYGMYGWAESMFIESYGDLDKSNLDEELSCSELYAKVLMNKGSLKVNIYDCEMFNPQIITLDRLAVGIKYMYDNYPNLIDLENLGSIDAFICADVIQIAVFDELVYG